MLSSRGVELEGNDEDRRGLRWALRSGRRPKCVCEGAQAVLVRRARWRVVRVTARVSRWLEIERQAAAAICCRTRPWIVATFGHAVLRAASRAVVRLGVV